MLTSSHTTTHTTDAEQMGAPLLEHVGSVQSPVAIRDCLTDADELLVTLLAASPACARSFALFMHERLCERGDFDHADIWEAVLRLCRDPALPVNP
jgi:hypothetical protein